MMWGNGRSQTADLRLMLKDLMLDRIAAPCEDTLQLSSWTPPAPGSHLVPELVEDGINSSATKGPQSRDKQDWTMDPEEFRWWNKKLGMFQVDACCDVGGRNAHLKRFWTDCLAHRWDGLRIWCNPPFTDAAMPISRVLQHFQECRERDPSTSACFILPYFKNSEWENALAAVGSLKLMHTYEAGCPLFYAPDGGAPKTKWPVQVWWAAPGGQEHQKVKTGEESFEMLMPLETEDQPRRSARLLTSPKDNVETMEEESSEVPQSTTEAPRPRQISFLKEVMRALPMDKHWKAKVKKCRARPGRSVDGFKMIGDLLWRVAAGHHQLIIPANRKLKI
jgi:hypothetical protein